MHCVDVNVLIYAHRGELPDHNAIRAWLDTARRGSEPLGLPSVVESGFLRLITHPRVFREPSTLDQAIEFVDALWAAPATTRVEPEGRHRELFLELCRGTAARGNRIPDAYLAAIAIEHDATWVSCDRGFSRFAGLRWRHPLEPST